MNPESETHGSIRRTRVRVGMMMHTFDNPPGPHSVDFRWAGVANDKLNPARAITRSQLGVCLADSLQHLLTHFVGSQTHRLIRLQRDRLNSDNSTRPGRHECQPEIVVCWACNAHDFVDLAVEIELHALPFSRARRTAERSERAGGEIGVRDSPQAPDRGTVLALPLRA